MSIHTARLTLRLVELSDAAFLYQLMNTSKWLAFIGDRGVDSVEAARMYIEEKMDPRIESRGFINHVMIITLTGEVVGTCSLHDRPGVEGLDIGYALLPQYEGRGFATEGAKAMVKLAFEKFQQEKVSAITSAGNTASCKLLEKLGFTHQGFIQFANDQEQIKLYTLVKK